MDLQAGQRRATTEHDFVKSSPLMVSKRYAGDVAQVLATRHDNGTDYWATPDGRIGVGGPFSTIESLFILRELRVPRSHEAIKGAGRRILEAHREDGSVRVAPKGTVYPCHTAIAAAALCRNGFARDRRTQAMLAHLLSSRFDDGGWRCKKFSGGRGPETEFSNPGVTLYALDAFRAAGMNERSRALNRAVETLLVHWVVRVPTGPCHFGIGSRFMQVEYPFLRYNLFYYVYVLSFYARARRDKRFKAAAACLAEKLDERGRVVVERPNRKLARLEFCRKGEPSELATKRYREICKSMGTL